MGVLWAEVSSKGGAASGTAKCPRLREQLNVLRRRSGLRKALGPSQLQKDARTFFLGPPWPAGMSSLLFVRDAHNDVEHVLRS